MSRTAIQAAYRLPDASRSELLSGINMTAEQGAITLIAGCTGSGKSTLLHLLAGIKQPSSGSIGLFGTAGYVHQYPEHQFFLPRVQDELMYALKGQRMKPSERELRMKEAADSCGVDAELMDRSPLLLSGGQKRRVALAAVVAADPAWLLLDEPTAGLDSDMVHWLAEQLTEWKQKKGARGGGIIVASHDLDVFLPIADHVVLLREGRTLGQWTVKELVRNPQPWVQSGLGMPACIRLAGFAGSSDLDAGNVGAALARRILNNSSFVKKELGIYENESVESTEADERVELDASWEARGDRPNEHDLVGGAIDRSVSYTGNEENGGGYALRARRFYALLHALDPRAKWLFYLLFSLALLIRPNLAVSAAGMSAIGGIAAAAGIGPGRWLKPLRPMLFFILLACGISGLQVSFSWTAGEFPLSGTGFRLPDALEALRRLSALLPVMAGGILFSVCTTALSIQKGLDALLQRIPRFGRGAEIISLCTALMFRFLRFIPEELKRFALLASLRGRPGGGPGKLRLRQLPAFFIPMLLSVMQHAEDLSMALEARGYGRKGVKRTNAAPLRWRRIDGAACWAGALLAVCFIGLRWLTG
jgi:energy-coupling factor transport system permease/ATP-binding protein